MQKNFGFNLNLTTHGKEIAKKLAQVRKEGIINYLKPDGKVQVTVEYNQDVPTRVHTIVISTQHIKNANLELLKKDIMEKVILSTVPKHLLDKNTKYLINPIGRFEIGGPLADSGLTGGKIIVDTYGGYARHGGGAFSGKDPTKVDRSASYAARYVAKNIVAAGLADKCEVGISYAIGVSKPLSVYVDTFGTSELSNERLEEIVGEVFDLRPAAIIRDLDLRKPIYKQLAAYGHFGREDLGVKWEETDKVEELKKYI